MTVTTYGPTWTRPADVTAAGDQTTALGSKFPGEVVVASRSWRSATSSRAIGSRCCRCSGQLPCRHRLRRGGYRRSRLPRNGERPREEAAHLTAASDEPDVPPERTRRVGHPRRRETREHRCP